MNCLLPVPCPLCNALGGKPWISRSTDYISGEVFGVLRCTSCGLGITSPLPIESLDKYYGPRYRTDRHGFTGRMRVHRRVAAARRQFPAGFRGTVIDIGAGDGEFARAMQAQGWRVIVTEYGDESVKRLLDQGLDARPSHRFDLRGETVDLVTIWHVLEHTADPAPLLHCLREAMHARSVLQVSVPNIDSWQARLTRGRWLHLDVPRHNIHFTPRTLDRLLSASGFRIERTRTVALEYDWFGFIQSSLNALTRRPNVLFERLTGGRWPACDWGDVAISSLLAGPLAAVTLPVTLISGLFRRGGTLMVNARPAPQATPSADASASGFPTGSAHRL